MKKSLSENITLDIDAADGGTEIFVVDSELKRIGSAIGCLKIGVQPGIYKIRFRSGSTQQDRLVEIVQGQKYCHVTGDKLPFQSAAPILATRTSHEYHSKPAARLSRQVMATFGFGARLFVFLREQDPKESDDFEPSAVSLHDLKGDLIANLSDGVMDPKALYAGLNLELNPGNYRVRVDTSSLGSYEIFVVLVHNWQTQVFLTRERFYSEGQHVRFPSLRQATILMARSTRGFDPGWDDDRLTELARIGLNASRDVISREDMSLLLSEKFEDPMLGLYAAHLLLARRRPPRQLIKTVCGNLARLLGRNHPDLLALCLRYGPIAPGAARRNDRPPMLSRSWELVVSASRRRAGIVPAKSMAGRIASNVLPSETWLIHRVSKGQPVKFEDTSLASARREVDALLKRGRDAIQASLEMARFGQLELSVLEHGVLEVVANSLDENPQQAASRVRRAINKLKAPSFSLAQSIQSLVHKLEETESNLSSSSTSLAKLPTEEQAATIVEMASRRYVRKNQPNQLADLEKYLQLADFVTFFRDSLRSAAPLFAFSFSHDSNSTVSCAVVPATIIGILRVVRKKKRGLVDEAGLYRAVLSLSEREKRATVRKLVSGKGQEKQVVALILDDVVAVCVGILSGIQ